jgi:hypothetical protein
MGRFLQTDPMGYQDSLNLYQAFNMNPANFIDPMGRNRESIEGQKQSEISALESRLYELEIAISSSAVANNQVGMIRAYGEYLKLNEIYKQKTGKYFIRKKAGKPIMTEREAYALTVSTIPGVGEVDDFSILLANYSLLEGEKVELNLAGKGVAVLGAALPFVKTKHLLKIAKWIGLEKFLLKAQKKVSTKLVHLKERIKGKVPTGKGTFDFPEDPNVFTKQLGVEPKVSVTQHGTTRMVWEPNSNTRIRFESHPEGLMVGDPGFNPRHHGSHYHIEIKPDNMTWNQAKRQNLIKKIKPENYVPGMGTGFLPYEKLPGKVIEK